MEDWSGIVSDQQTAAGERPLLAHYPSVNQGYPLQLQPGRGENGMEANMDSDLKKILCNIVSVLKEAKSLKTQNCNDKIIAKIISYDLAYQIKH